MPQSGSGVLGSHDPSPRSSVPKTEHVTTGQVEPGTQFSKPTNPVISVSQISLPVFQHAHTFVPPIDLQANLDPDLHFFAATASVHGTETSIRPKRQITVNLSNMMTTPLLLRNAERSFSFGILGCSHYNPNPTSRAIRIIRITCLDIDTDRPPRRPIAGDRCSCTECSSPVCIRSNQPYIAARGKLLHRLSRNCRRAASRYQRSILPQSKSRRGIHKPPR